MALPELYRHDWTIFKSASATDTSRVPASSATIGVYREGATAQGAGSEVGAGATITVHDPGAIVAGDSVSIGTSLTTILRSVTSITSTTIVVAAGGIGAFAWLDGSRIVPINTRPLTYTDDQGAEATAVASQATTDSLGEAFVYTRTAHIEALVTDGSTLTLLQDLTGVGGRYEVSPFDWGARFDGATDDQAAFADALEYIKAKGGGILRLPPGVTRLGSAVTLASMSSVQIIGAGRGITTIEINHAGTGFDLTGTGNDVGFSNLTISRLSGTGDDIQIAVGYARTSIKDVLFSGGGIAVDDHGEDMRLSDAWCTGNGWTSFVRLDASNRSYINSLVCSPGNAWTRGIDIDTGTIGARITNLDISPTAVVSGIGIHIRDTAAGNDPNDIAILEAHLECGTTGNGIQIDTCAGVRINGGTILDSSRGVVVGGGSGVKIIGTTIVGMRNEGIDINAGSHVRIVEVDISDINQANAGTNCIDIAAGVDDVSVWGMNGGSYLRSTGLTGVSLVDIAPGVSDRIQLAGIRNDAAGLAALVDNGSTSLAVDISHNMDTSAATSAHTAAISGGAGTVVGVKFLTGAETTTSVQNVHTLILNQSGNTTWTDFTGSTNAQKIQVLNIHATSTATFTDGGSLILASASRVLSQGDSIEFVRSTNLSGWVETGFTNVL